MGDGNEQLATADEIRVIAVRVTAVLDAINASEVDPLDLDEATERAQWRRFEAVVGAMHYCATSAIILGDPSVIPVLDDLRDQAQQWTVLEDDEKDPAGLLLTAIDALLERDDVPPDVLLPLADHEEAQVRTHVAEQLDPGQPIEREALRKLAADPNADVRKAAQQTLAEVEPSAWWLGKFQRDPLRTLSSDEVAQARPWLAKLVELLDAGSALYTQHMAAFVDLVRRLPDALAVEVIERQARDLSTLRLGDPKAGLFLDLLRRRDGVAALERLVHAWSEARGDDHKVAVSFVAAGMSQLPTALHRKVGVALMAMVVQPEEEYSAPCDLAAEILLAGWRVKEDATQLFEMYFSPVGDEENRRPDGRSKLYAAHERWHLPVATRQRFLRRWVSDTPPVPPASMFSMQTLIDKLPDRLLRPTVKRMIAEGTERLRLEWALRLWFTRLHDEARDGSRTAGTEAFFADGRLRAVILHNPMLAEHAFVPARRALRAGELDREGAGTVLHGIHRFYGGLSSPRDSRAPSPEENLKRRSPQGSDQPVPFQVPRSLRGPITPQEWEIYRAVRARQPPADFMAWLNVIHTLPPGPWQPVDRPFLDAVVAQVRGGEDGLALFLGNVLADKATREDLALFDQLIDVVSATEDGGSTCDSLRAAREKARARLGVVIPSTRRKRRAPGTPSNEPVAWMDEPDDG